jgi:hypothetical protein
MYISINTILILLFGNVFAKPCNNCHLNSHKCKSHSQQPTHTIQEPTQIIQEPTPTQTIQPQLNNTIKVRSGTNATLTYFTDTVTQCYGSDIPVGNGVAVNPLLLGFTLDDWNTKFSNVEANNIPWCGKMMNVTVNGNTFSSRIIDTCDPSGNEFLDPNTGLVVGGKCNYENVIDLYGEAGLEFLKRETGDDFYQGALDWVIY